MSENKNDQQSSAEQIEVTFDEAPENDMKKAEKAEEDTGSKKTRRKGNGKKKLKYGTLAAVSTVIFTAVVVLVNIIAGVFFKKYPLTLDLTKNAKYSISEKSEEYVKSIDRDVKFRVFASEENFTSLNEYTKQAAEVLKRYTEYNSHITVEYIDIDSNPDIVSEYTDQEITAFSMIAESPSLDENGKAMTDENGKALRRVREVSLLDLITFKPEVEEEAQSYGVSAEDYLMQVIGGGDANVFAFAVQRSLVEASSADQAFISALIAVTDPDPVEVCVLTGRNELASISYFTKLLKANGYSVKEINITSEDIPEGTDMCIIPAPASDYMEGEIKKVDDFVANDGNMGKQLIYIASYGQQSTPNLSEFLEEYNIAVGDGIIVENDPEYFTMTNAGQIYTISNDVSKTYAEDIDVKNANILLSYSRPVKVISEGSGKLKTEALINSTDNAAVVNSETGENIENGKQAFAVVSSKTSFEEGGSNSVSNVLVLGSPDIVSDQFLMFDQFQNRTYMLSLCNSMTGKTSNGMTIEPKVISANIFDITAEQIRTLKIIFIGVIPVVTLMIGLIIWLRRKNR